MFYGSYSAVSPILVHQSFPSHRAVHCSEACGGCAGEFEAVGFNDFSSVTGAVSTFGFVFYIQPIMMPLLSEMPASERGVKILSWSTRIVVLGELAVLQSCC